MENERNIIINKDKPKVVHLSVWDSGGAATSTLRLHLGLLNLGYDSKLLVLYKTTNYPEIHPIKRKKFAENWTWEKHNDLLNIFISSKYPKRPKDSEIFTTIESIANVQEDENILNADIINFHWIPSIIDFTRDVDFFKSKKIVWRIPDENPYTGGCHYTSGCLRYYEECKSCPQLGSNSNYDLSNYQFHLKKDCYDSLNIHFVCISKYSAEKAKQSKLLHNKKIFVINNGVPTSIFHVYNQHQIRDFLKIPNNSFIILFGTSYLAKRKGMEFLPSILEKIPKTINGKQVILVTFGPYLEIRQWAKIPIIQLGNISNPINLASMYSMADIFLCLSTEETGPNTVIESICCGTPVIGFNIGVIPEAIEHQINGWIANSFDISEVIEGIYFWGNQTMIHKNKIAEEAKQKFDISVQVKNYDKLYNYISGNIKEFPLEKENTQISFDYLKKKNNIYLVKKKDLINFSGLDVKLLNKVAREFLISPFELFVLYYFYQIFLEEYYFQNINFIFFNSIPKDFKMPNFYHTSFILINVKSTINNLKTNSRISDKYKIFESDLDSFIQIMGVIKPRITFVFFDIEEIAEYNIDFFKFIKILSTNESSWLKTNYYLNPKLTFFLTGTKDSLINIIFKIKTLLETNKLEFNKNDLDKTINELSSGENCLLGFNQMGKEKYVLILNIEKSFLNPLNNLNINTCFFPKKVLTNYPKITIITPNLNQAEFLEECIDSILSQNYPNLEYIIIDGGSKDKSIEIIKKYEKFLKLWVSEPDKGQYDAINKGFKYSSGEIIAWLNADDFYFPGSLFFISEIFSAYPFVDWLTTELISVMDYNGSILIDTSYKFYSLTKFLDNKWDSPFIQQESTFWRRRLWDSTNAKLDSSLFYAADLELWIRFFKKTKLYIINVPLAVFRKNPNQKTSKALDKYYNEAYNLIDKERSKLTNNKILENAISENLNFYDLIAESKLTKTLPYLDKIIQNFNNFILSRQLAPISKEILMNFVYLLNKIWKNNLEKS